MRVGEYRIDVTPLVSSAGQGLNGLRITLREPAGGATVPSLETVHERPLHLFIVGRDLEYFAHLHPTQAADGTFAVTPVIPAGEYVAIADFLPAGGSPQLVQRMFVSPGRPRGEPQRTVTALGPQIAGGVRVQAVSTGLVAGRATSVRFMLTGAGDGRPILDLEPFLGAAAHLLVVSEDLTEAVHAHSGELPRTEPALVFDLTLPRAGQYRGWLQFQRQGVVVTVPVRFTAR